MRLRLIINNSSPVQTTDATVTTVHTFTPSSHSLDNVVLRVAGTILGKDSSNNGVSAEIRGTFRVVAGTVTLRGSTSLLNAMIGDASLTGSVVSLDVSGSDIRLRIAGIVATTINWTAWLEVLTGEA